MKLLDGPQQMMFARFGQRDGRAATSGSAGAADAVQVGFRRGGHVVVDDVRQMLDVEAASRDVGRDQHVGLLRAKESHDAVSLPLLHPAVQRLARGGRVR